MPNRIALHHTPPAFVSGDAWFFVTICCEHRTLNQLCRPRLATDLLKDAAHYHHGRIWTLQMFLLMPDHLHAILAVPRLERLSEVIRNWKRLTARAHGVRWQRNFFDHRLRSCEALEAKARYIRENPVRAGLVDRAEDWPHLLDHDLLEKGR